MNVEHLTILFLVIAFCLIHIYFFYSRFKFVKPNKILILYGVLNTKNKEDYKVYTKGQVFVIPMLEQYYELETDKYNFCQDFMSYDTILNNIKIYYNIVSKPDVRKLDKLLKNYFKKSKFDLINEINSILRKAIIKVIETKEYTNISKKIILKEITQTIKINLVENGFEDPSFNNVFIELHKNRYEV